MSKLSSLTYKTWAWAAIRIPLLFFARPRILELDDEHCVVELRLRRRTRNHLGSMYFGALAIGADTAGGLIAFETIRARKANVSLIFKDFHAEFLQRAEGDVHFTCRDGAAIRELVDRVIASGERETLPVKVVATVPSVSNEPVAEFTLGLSLKRRD